MHCHMFTQLVKIIYFGRSFFKPTGMCLEVGHHLKQANPTTAPVAESEYFGIVSGGTALVL